MPPLPRHPLYDDSIRDLPPSALMPIVVGAHPEAEITDRPLAYALLDGIRATGGDSPPPLEPIVLTDLWYINHAGLRLQPTITIGRPAINAVTAYLARRVPTAFVIDDAYRIQIDPEMLDQNACIWGEGPETTRDAVARFVDRYLADYLRSIVPAPAD